MKKNGVEERFRLDEKVTLITGGAGFLGRKHAETIAEMGGYPVIVDLNKEDADEVVSSIKNTYKVEALACIADIAIKESVEKMVEEVMEYFGRIDILINNAGFSVKGEIPDGMFAPFEEYPLDIWEKGLKVNLTGPFLVTQSVGRIMVNQQSGVILNIASDVGVISPDHRIYDGLGTGPNNDIPFNTPAWYSASKAGLINLTRYLATYWAKYNIRVNSISPAGVFHNHDPEFVRRLSNLIPLGRMAHEDEYKGSIIFLVSDASSFMTGTNLIVDGGRTCW